MAQKNKTSNKCIFFLNKNMNTTKLLHIVLVNLRLSGFYGLMTSLLIKS